MGCHILQYHNGIIHHHTYCYGEGAERYDVQRISGSKEVNQGCQQGDRDCHYDNEGCAPSSKEEVNHQHNHKEGDEYCLLKAIDCVDNIV